MKWGIWMSPIWAALNKKLALFMNDYNGALKHHRCRRCRYKDGTNASQCQSFLLKTIFTFMLFFFFFLKHFSTTFQTLVCTNMENYSCATGRSWEVLPLCPDCQLVCQSTCTSAEKVHKWRSCCVFTENFNKTSLINFLFPFQMLTFLNFLRPCKHM